MSYGNEIWRRRKCLAVALFPVSLGIVTSQPDADWIVTSQPDADCLAIMNGTAATAGSIADDTYDVTNSPGNVTKSAYDLFEWTSMSADAQTGNNAIELTVYITFEVGIAFLAFINNLLVLLALWKFNSLRTPTNWFVASLAIADIAVAVFGIPCAILLRLGLAIANDGCYDSDATIPTGPSVTQNVCLILVSLIIFLTQVSIFSLLLIAIDRFIAIHYPFRYGSFMTANKTRIGIVAAWAFAAAIGLAPELGWNKWTNSETVPCRCAFEDVISMHYMVYFNFFACVLTPLIAMGVIYLLIFRSAKSQLEKIYADVRKMKRRRTTSKPTIEQLHQNNTAALLGLASAFSNHTDGKAWHSQRSATIGPILESGTKRPSPVERSTCSTIESSSDNAIETIRTTSCELSNEPTSNDNACMDVSNPAFTHPNIHENGHVVPGMERHVGEVPSQSAGDIGVATCPSGNTNGHVVTVEDGQKNGSIATIDANGHYAPIQTNTSSSLGFLPAVGIDNSHSISTRPDESHPPGRSKLKEQLQKLHERNTFSMGDIREAFTRKEKDPSLRNTKRKIQNSPVSALRHSAHHILRPGGKAHSFSASTTVPRIRSPRTETGVYQIRAAPLSQLTNRDSSIDASRSTIYTSEHGVWTTVDSANSLLQHRMRRKSELIKKEIHAARSLATVVGAFAICWLPLHILNTLTLLCPSSCPQPSWLKDLAILLSHFNSLINPLIYAFKLRDFRNAFRRILSRIVTSHSLHYDSDEAARRQSDIAKDESRNASVVTSQQRDKRKAANSRTASNASSDESRLKQFPKLSVTNADHANNNKSKFEHKMADTCSHKRHNMSDTSEDATDNSQLCDCLRVKRRSSQRHISYSSRMETELSVLASDSSFCGERLEQLAPLKGDGPAFRTSKPETALSTLLSSSETVL